MNNSGINISLEHIRYFVEIVEAGNLTKAAQNLFVSQPALSKVIKKMEHDLSAQLFAKSFQKQQLTDTGEAFLEQARLLLQQYDNLVSVVQEVRDLERGTITLGIPMLISYLYFCDIILDFKKRYPDINIDMIEIGDDSITEKVLQGDIDIGVVTENVGCHEFICRPVLTDELVTFMPLSNRLSQQESVTFADLEGQKLHMFSSDFAIYRQIIAGCNNAGFQPNISTTSSQRLFLADIARATNGVAIMPQPIVADLSDANTCIRPFSPPLPWEILVIMKKHKYITYAMQALLNHTENFFQQL